jgi:hypothetical protein
MHKTQWVQALKIHLTAPVELYSAIQLDSIGTGPTVDPCSRPERRDSIPFVPHVTVTAALAALVLVAALAGDVHVLKLAGEGIGLARGLGPDHSCWSQVLRGKSRLGRREFAMGPM